MTKDMAFALAIGPTVAVCAFGFVYVGMWPVALLVVAGWLSMVFYEHLRR
jgi:hypothetical protein